MNLINIAIDGYSACGKSTLARDLASRLGYRHIDSGSMYRAITAYFLDLEVDLSDLQQIKVALMNIELNFILLDQVSVLTMNGIKQGKNLRIPAIDKMVSKVAAIAPVREVVVKQQQEIGVNRGVVMDGRDIGSVVYPEAALKIFLDADLETRVLRRREELRANGLDLSHDVIKANLSHRDHIDSSREHSPLLKTPDAILIDNTNLSRKEQLEMIVALAQCRMH